MSDWWHQLGFSDFVTTERLLGVVRALLILFVGIVLARLAVASLSATLKNRLAAQEAMLVRRLVFYAMLGIILTMSLHQLGFQLGVLLGAAGVLTVAIGFASQTSASNLISGLFLIAERPFAVGDAIKLDSLAGVVVSIDLLSVKIRTWDNLFVRVPNESIIKSNVTTISRYPLRRIDMIIGIAYKEDIERVREILYEVADKNPLCMEEPKPFFLFQRFADSALELQFSVWCARENFVTLRNGIYDEIKQAFDAHGVEIPFPHRSHYAGSETAPFPIRIVADDAGAAARGPDEGP